MSNENTKKPEEPIDDGWNSYVRNCRQAQRHFARKMSSMRYTQSSIPWWAEGRR